MTLEVYIPQPEMVFWLFPVFLSDGLASVVRCMLGEEEIQSSPGNWILNLKTCFETEGKENNGQSSLYVCRRDRPNAFRKVTSL